MIGNDGILCCGQDKNQKKQFFKVQNTASGQKIYAKGLGTTGESGQLIKKEGAYKEFANKLVNFFEEYFVPSCKKSGFTNALNAIINALPDDVFITSV